MNKIEVFNETEEKICLNEIKKIISFTLKKEKIKKAVVNVILVDEKEIQKINREYRNIDRVTDVISFALEEGESIKFKFRLLGDIYICVPRMKKQAINYGHSEKRELLFLTVHGLLHLLGYDHMNKEDEKEMFKKQELILNDYGITR